MNENPDSLRQCPDSTVPTEEDPESIIQKATKTPKSSNLQASFTLFKSFIGTGVLALPYAYKTAGTGLSIIVTIIIALMLAHSFILLLKTADDRFGNSKASFQRLAMEVLGPKGKYFAQILLIIEQLGCCIGVLIFTKDFLNYLFCTFDIESLCNTISFNVIFALLLIVPLSLIDNMHYFYIPSLAANFFIILGLFAQMYFNLEVAYHSPDVTVSTLGKRFTEFNFGNLALFFGVAMFSYEGVGVTLSIRDSMEKPQDLPKLLKKQLIGLTVLYILFSAMSYMILGDKIPDIIFFSLPADQPNYLFILMMYNASVLLSYPIQLFPALRIIEGSNCLKNRLFTETGQCKNRLLKYGLRFTVIGLIFFIAYTAKSFSLFLNLLGSCVFTLLGFTLPICMYMLQFKNRSSRKEKILNYTILAVTGVFGAIGFVQSLRALLGLE